MTDRDFSLYDEDTALTAEQILAARARDKGPTPDPAPHVLPPLQETGGLRFHVLGSGSKGNSCVIEGPEGALLIDCGFSKKETFARLETLGIPKSSLRAILLTHEHSDHTRGLGVLVRGLHIPVYTTYGTAQAPSVSREVACVPLHSRDQVTIAGIKVTTFPTSHDAREPIAFRFEADRDAVGYLTDCGTLSPESLELLCDTRILALESNHDPHLLQTGPYPYDLKVRIASDRGHLSNIQARDALATLVTSRLQTLVGMHLSETNNEPSLSVNTLVPGLSREGIGVFAARQNRPRSFG